MRRISLAALAFLALASVPAHACGCCYVADPTGTPTNVRDNPNGSAIFTLRNHDIVNGPDEIKKDSRGREWALVENDQRTGWVFLRYLKCDADSIRAARGFKK